MTTSHGKTHWFIPDGFIPPDSSGEMESHESICVLNCGETASRLTINAYFEDREPIEQFTYKVDAKRTKHIRTTWLKNEQEETIPKGVPYALEVISDVPVIIQYSRLDSTQKELALMTTLGYSAGS
ncbi:sensory rhodopsin transducer [Alkalicoccus daliensis]|uniref:Sensory rhodopsin transducer n=1 Tax=Alkalicoccus daliensis TaxID=745820 RepID=A0A1H0F0K2_9BACI|nr:sensory rhodopsin transducer [Alkalicoccus daliensis]SDN88103.1 hypothetical protein SAMN04488053_104141 [Alkalicoccus daliensis]